MSDGGFDVDKLLKSRRKTENLFGIITDPKTKQRVSYPLVSKNYSSEINSNNSTLRYNQSKKKKISSINTNKDNSKYNYHSEENQKKERDFHKKLLDESIKFVGNISEKDKCQNCKSAYKCKLKEEGFIELCPY